MTLETIFQMPIVAQNPIAFPVGAHIVDKYSGETYEVTKHGKNGISTLSCLNSGCSLDYNSCNNAYFYPAPYVSPAVQSLIG